MKLDLPFHPLIFGVLPAYHLYVENLGSVSPEDLLVPTALIFLFIGLVLGIATMRHWDTCKMALGLSVFFIWFFAYGFILRWYNGLTLAGIGLASYPRYLVAIFTILLLVCIWILSRPGWDPATPTRFLNVVGIVLLILTTLTLAAQVSAGSPVPRAPLDLDRDADLVSCSWNATGDRDVYYIILDTYARGDVLERYYHYNNSWFLANLTARGFYVPQESLTNYPDSASSLASSLNMEYLEDKGDMEYQREHLEYNQVSRVFREHGYTVIHFRSGYAVTDRNAYAEVVKNEGLPKPFHNRLAGNTYLRYLLSIPSQR